MGETFGEEIRRRRRAADLTQEQLAELAGVSRTTLRNAESGRNQPRGGRAEAMRSVLEQAERGELRPKCSFCAEGDPRPEAEVLEEIARRLDALAETVPEDLFPDDDSTPEAIRVMRRTYRHAARIARGEAP